MSQVATPSSRLTDQFEIRNLVNRWAQLNDVGDLDEYGTCWSDDASIELRPGKPLRGPAEIKAGTAELRQAGLSGPGTHRRHVVTTHVVDFDGPDNATCQVYLLLLVADPTRGPEGTPITPPVVRSMNHVKITLRRTPKGWKLTGTRAVV